MHRPRRRVGRWHSQTRLGPTSRWMTTWICSRRSRRPREGAKARPLVYRQRRERELTAQKLRRAIAKQHGDPVLMQMIRASYLGDAEALAGLAAHGPCQRESPT